MKYADGNSEKHKQFVTVKVLNKGLDKLQYLLFMSILHIAVMYNKHMQKYNILPHNLLMMYIWEISISLSLQFLLVIVWDKLHRIGITQVHQD